MMDPLTALGIASNIVQFVQYGNELLSQSRLTYRENGRPLLSIKQKFDATKEIFERAVAGPGTKDLPMPLSRATRNQRLQAWEEFENACEMLRGLLKPKTEPWQRLPFRYLDNVRVKFRMKKRGKQLMKTMDEKMKFLEDAVNSDRLDFIKEQNQAIIRHLASSGALGATLPPCAIQDPFDSTKVSYPFHDLSIDLQQVALRYRPDLDHLVLAGPIQKPTQGASIEVSRQPVKRSNSLPTLNALNYKSSSNGAQDSLSPSISARDTLARTASTAATATTVASTAASTISPIAEKAAIALGSATIGIAGLKVLVDFEIARRKQITDDKNSDTLRQAANTGDRKTDIDEANRVIASRLADAEDRKLDIEAKNAETARITAYSAALNVRTTREKFLWEMGKGGDGKGGNDESPDTGLDSGSSGCKNEDAGLASPDPRNSSIPMADKGKGKATDQMPITSSNTPGVTGSCNTAAAITGGGNGIAPEKNSILPMVPSSSQPIPLVPLPRSEQRRKEAELDIMAALIQEINTPPPAPFRKNRDKYEALQSDKNAKSAETERILGELRAKFLTGVPISGHSQETSSEAAATRTLYAKDSSNDRSGSLTSDVSSSIDHIAIDSPDVFSIYSASDTNAGGHFNPMESRLDNLHMRNLGSQTGNGKSPSNQGQSGRVENGGVEGPDAISPLAVARLKK